MYQQQRPVKIFTYFFFYFHSPKLFHDRLSLPLEMLLKGEVTYIVSGRALRQDFTLELTSPEATGKVRIGGKLTELFLNGASSNTSEFVAKYSVSGIVVIRLSLSFCSSQSFLIRFVNNSNLLIRDLERLLHTKVLITLWFWLKILVAFIVKPWLTFNRGLVNRLSNSRALMFCIRLRALCLVTCVLVCYRDYQGESYMMPILFSFATVLANTNE